MRVSLAGAEDDPALACRDQRVAGVERSALSDTERRMVEQQRDGAMARRRARQRWVGSLPVLSGPTVDLKS